MFSRVVLAGQVQPAHRAHQERKENPVRVVVDFSVDRQALKATRELPADLEFQVLTVVTDFPVLQVFPARPVNLTRQLLDHRVLLAHLALPDRLRAHLNQVIYTQFNKKSRAFFND